MTSLPVLRTLFFAQNVVVISIEGNGANTHVRFDIDPENKKIKVDISGYVRRSIKIESSEDNEFEVTISGWILHAHMYRDNLNVAVHNEATYGQGLVAMAYDGDVPYNQQMMLKLDGTELP